MAEYLYSANLTPKISKLVNQQKLNAFMGYKKDKDYFISFLKRAQKITIFFYIKKNREWTIHKEVIFTTTNLHSQIDKHLAKCNILPRYKDHEKPYNELALKSLYSLTCGDLNVHSAKSDSLKKDKIFEGLNFLGGNLVRGGGIRNQRTKDSIRLQTDTVSYRGRGGGVSINSRMSSSTNVVVSSNPKDSHLTGGRTKTDIMRTIRNNRYSLLYAYNRHLSSNPDIKGKITVKWTINDSGTVIQCNILETTLNDPTFGTIVVQNIKKWSFDKAPVQEDTTMIVKSFIFTQ